MILIDFLQVSDFHDWTQEEVKITEETIEWQMVKSTLSQISGVLKREVIIFV